MNQPTVWVLLCIAGGVGAMLRFVLDGLIRGAIRIAYPLGTTVINLLGSLALGMLTGSAAHGGLPPQLLLILGGGLMGGFTTFSTASLETVRLAQERRYFAAVMNGVGMLLLCIAGAYLGLVLGRLL